MGSRAAPTQLLAHVCSLCAPRHSLSLLQLFTYLETYLHSEYVSSNMPVVTRLTYYSQRVTFHGILHVQNRRALTVSSGSDWIATLMF